MIDIQLRCSLQPPWAHHHGIWVRGYAYLPSGQMLAGEALGSYLAQADSAETLCKFAVTLNGLFAAAGTLPFGPFALVDRVRSIPIFYRLHQSVLDVADSPYPLIGPPEFCPNALAEFRSAAYCLGGKTLLDGVLQVEASSLLFIGQGSALQREYFCFATPSVDPLPWSNAKERLKGLIDGAMARMLGSIGGGPIAIPLSGGYDSRLILAWLVQQGYSQVTAFTYGRAGNAEMRAAEQVAHRLGVEWVPIPYTDEVVAGVTDDMHQLEQYVRYASMASSMPFFQDYPALLYMRRKGLLKPNATVVPGHSGDFIAGSHLLPCLSRCGGSTQQRHLFAAHHKLYPLNRPQRRWVRSQIEAFVGAYPKHIPYSIAEWWDFKERQAKYIANSCRAYQFFGHELRLPLFDNALVDFFRICSLEQKLYKRLYVETITEHYLKPLNLCLPHELQPTPHEVRLQGYKEFIRAWLSITKPIRPVSGDTACYGAIAARLGDATSINVSFEQVKRGTNTLIIDWYLKYLDAGISG